MLQLQITLPWIGPITFVSLATPSLDSIHRELVNRSRGILFSLLKNSGQKFRFVRGIREMLGLQAKPVTELVDPSAFSLICAVQKIAAIKLESWFGREDLQNPSALG